MADFERPRRPTFSILRESNFDWNYSYFDTIPGFDENWRFFLQFQRISIVTIWSMILRRNVKRRTRKKPTNANRPLAADLSPRKRRYGDFTKFLAKIPISRNFSSNFRVTMTNHVDLIVVWILKESLELLIPPENLCSWLNGRDQMKPIWFPLKRPIPNVLKPLSSFTKKDWPGIPAPKMMTIKLLMNTIYSVWNLNSPKRIDKFSPKFLKLHFWWNSTPLKL